MRWKLLTVFLVSFTVIFAFRAYGDYTTGGFPAYGLGSFLYWNLLYSLIPLFPVYFIIQIASPKSLQSVKDKKAETITSKNSFHPVTKVIVTVLAVIVGVWVGGYIGILFTADRSELDALTGGLYGAPIGGAIALLACWFIFAKRGRSS